MELAALNYLLTHYLPHVQIQHEPRPALQQHDQQVLSSGRLNYLQVMGQVHEEADLDSTLPTRAVYFQNAENTAPHLDYEVILLEFE